MDYKQRAQFRKSDAWHAFKAKCRLLTSTDFITREPLSKTWNLHHLDLNVKHYDDISDIHKFMPLNKKTHELVHELYKTYRRDHKVLDRLKIVLEKMEELTDGKES